MRTLGDVFFVLKIKYVELSSHMIVFLIENLREEG